MSLYLADLMRQQTAKTVLSQLDLSDSGYLDKLAALATTVTGFDAAAIVLYEEDHKVCLGKHRCKAASWSRACYDRSLTKDVHHFPEFDRQYPNSPMTNGEFGSYASAAVSRIMIQDEVVGGVWVYCTRRRPALTTEAKNSLIDIATLANTLIFTKAELKLSLANVFSLANR